MSRSGSVTLDKSPPLSVPVLAFGKVRVALEDLPCPFQFQNSATHPPMHGQTSCGVSTPGKGIRMNPTTQLNLDDIMLRKRSRSQKTTCRVIPLAGNDQNRQIIDREVDSWVPGAGENEGIGGRDG